MKRAWRFFFGDAWRAFGTMSLVLLLSLAVAPAKGFFREWHSYQNGYVKLVRTRGDAVTLQRRFTPGIQQIWIPEMGVVDRCTTCHVALKETSLKDVSAQPYRPHPPIPHSLTEFGCVACHRGQGPATTVEEAHSSTLAWEQPLLPTKYLESGCGQCHLGTLQSTPRLDEGRQLLAREGCVNCHNVRQGDGTVLKATDDPPSLEHVADKTSREWIYSWLKDPQAYSSTATMPNFGLSDEDARDISAFLLAQSNMVVDLAVNGQCAARGQIEKRLSTMLYVNDRQTFVRKDRAFVGIYSAPVRSAVSDHFGHFQCAGSRGLDWFGKIKDTYKTTQCDESLLPKSQ